MDSVSGGMGLDASKVAVGVVALNLVGDVHIGAPGVITRITYCSHVTHA